MPKNLYLLREGWARPNRLPSTVTNNAMKRTCWCAAFLIFCYGDQSMYPDAWVSYRTRSRRSFLAGIELLERREMLSGTPPTVTNVEVASSSWTPVFVSYLKNNGLGANGYAIPVGSSGQATTLTWDNINQIKITFSKDVLVDAADLSLSGVNRAAYTFSGFHYDPQTRLATWTLTSPLNKDKLRIDLDTNGADPLRDLDGNILDGEWTNNISTISGNGTTGGDFEFNLNVLPTDVNNTGNVTNDDYVFIHQLDGLTTTSPDYIAKRDINGDGVINSSDWQKALDRVLQTRPSGSPAGTTNDAPTTSGFDLIELNNPDEDVLISLLTGFDDIEGASGDLCYSIVSNSNPSLFDYVDIDKGTPEFYLSAASGASGRADITIRATDVGGLSVDTTVTVDVNYQNQPPHISNLIFADAGEGTWVVSGNVTDPDDNISNFIVQFSGVFQTRSAVDAQGHFEFAVVLDVSQTGYEYAVTYDPHGAQSNIAFGSIGLT